MKNTEVLVTYLVVALVVAVAYYFAMMKVDKKFNKEETMKMAGIIAAVVFSLLYLCGDAMCVDKAVEYVKGLVGPKLVPIQQQVGSPSRV